MGSSKLSRRAVLGAGGATATGLVTGNSIANSGRHRQPSIGSLGLPLIYHSPVLEPYVDPLPIPPLRSLGGTVVIGESLHQFHRDLAPARSWGYDGASHLGPTFIARRGENIATVFDNQLQDHIFAKDIDLSHHGTCALDLVAPPVSVHLHGAPNAPEHDGNPLDLFRPGTRKVYEFNNEIEASTLWLHDHAMGNTRLNVYGGLVTQYWVRDEWDTGEADNPLGLPVGRYEIPLNIQDKMFWKDGMPRFYATPTVPRNWWQGGFCGDVMCVNGKVWPNLDVDRGLYRFRILNGSSLSTYTFYFSNLMNFHVIGTDGGLLDAPALTHQLTVGVGERFDILVDFSGLQPGTKIQLLNDEEIVWPGQMLGSKMIPNVMQFTVQESMGFAGPVPLTLRGGHNQPDKLPPLQPAEFVRPATLNWLVDKRIPFSDMNLNNMRYVDEPVEMALQGRVEQWDFINNSPWDHTLHLHLVQFRIIGRQDFAPLLYLFFNPPPARKGKKWAPSADRFARRRPMDLPLPVEDGWKDTVRCPPGQITRILVRFPTAAELGFDPDAVFGYDEQGWPLQGYGWHCHIMDHEDHEMMLRYRLVASEPLEPPLQS